jgi:hypothetical protein
MNDAYEEAVFLHHLWNDAHHVWEIISNNVRSYFSKKIRFPFLSEIRQLVVETTSEAIDVDPPRIPAYHIGELIKRASGLYIATRFESYHLASVAVRGSKTEFASYDNKLHKVNTVKIRTPTEFLKLEIDKDAQQLLHDYISFLLSRPFLSLAANISKLEPRPIILTLSNVLSGSFMPIDVGATAIAYRDHLKRIDRDTMREIISFTEAMVRNAFIRPDITIHKEIPRIRT